MADSADQSVAIELVAQFQDVMSQLDAVGNKLGSALGAGADQAHDALERVKTDTHEATDEIGKSGEEAGRKWSEGFTLAVAAVAATFLDKIRDTIEQASEYASGLDVLKNITGDSPQQLQKFEFAMHSVGLSSGRATQELGLMQNKISEAAMKSKDTSSVFYQLGLSAKNMVGQDAITSFEQIATRIASMKNTTDQARLAMEAFGGRLGYQLLPLLKEGSEGIQKLMGTADPMGAIIGEEDIKNLQDYDVAMKDLAQVTQAFYVAVAGPIVPALKFIADETMRFMSAIERLSSDQKLTILFATLTASFFAFEQGLETVGSFLARNFITREVIDFLKDWATELRVLSGLALVVFLAYQTNFGGMRAVLQGIFSALKSAAEEFYYSMVAIATFAQQQLGPAFASLSEAMKPLVQAIGTDIVNAIKSIDWSSFVNDVEGVISAFAALVQGLASVSKWFLDTMHGANLLADALVVLTLAGVVGKVVAAFTVMKEAMLANVWVGLALEIRSVGGAMTFASMAAEGLGGVLTTLGGVLLRLAGGWIGILITALVLLVMNWSTVTRFLTDVWQLVMMQVADQFKEFTSMLGFILSPIATLLDALHILSGGFIANGDAVRGATRALDNYAAAADRAANAKARAAFNDLDVLFHGDKNKGHSGGGMLDVPDIQKPPTSDKPPGSDVPNAPVTKSGGKGEAVAEALDAIKNMVDQAKQKFADAKFEVDKLNVAIAALPKDAPLSKIQEDYAKKVRLTTAELTAQKGVVAALQLAQKETAADAAKQSDPKERRRFDDASRQYKNEANSALLEELNLETSITKIKNEGYDKEIAYWSAIAKDAGSTYAEQITAENNVLALKIKEHETTAAIHAQEEAILKLRQAQADAAVKLQEARNKQTEAVNTATTNQQVSYDEAHPKFGDKGVAQKQSDDVLKAQTDYNNALLTAQDAAGALTVAQDAAAAAAKKFGASSVEATTANLAEVNAETASLNATYAEAAAKAKLNETEQATSSIVTGTRDAFKQLIDSGLGTTLVQIIQGLQGSTLNLNQGFISLFQQSRSFHDIQEAFKEITSRLAQVFDAMRPVLDFFLGILIGITDVFLEMFNVLATILNVFGLNIQKIKLLDDTLDGLNNTVKPLLQITHDLPTMNEINAGKWADLQAQNNDLGNNMAIGFDKQAAKLGEVVGVLLGIKVLVALMAGQSLAKQASSGIFGKLESMLGFNKGSSNALPVTLDNGAGANDGGQFDSGNEAGGSWDDAENTTATTDNTSQLRTAATYTEALNVTQNQANQNTTLLNNTMGSLVSLLPTITSFLGNKMGGLGGSLVSGLGSVAGIFGTMAALKKGASAGSLDTGNYVSGGLDLLQGLRPGGTFSQTLGGAGDIVGTIFGGPIGGAIGNALGTVIGSFFGHKTSAYANPDIDDSQNYFQDLANLKGTAGSQNQYSESSTISGATGGQTGESAIEEELAKGMTQFMADTGLSASAYATDLKEFGASATGSGVLTHPDKNIGDIAFSGVTGQSGTTRYDALNAALVQFTQGLQTAGDVLNNTFGNAQEASLATIYGNGQVVTAAGGYNVAGNGGTATPAAPVTNNPTITVTIGTVTGATEDSMRSALNPVLNEWMQQMNRNANINGQNNSNLVGRN